MAAAEREQPTLLMRVSSTSWARLTVASGSCQREGVSWGRSRSTHLLGKAKPPPGHPLLQDTTRIPCTLPYIPYPHIHPVPPHPPTPKPPGRRKKGGGGKEEGCKEVGRRKIKGEKGKGRWSMEKEGRREGGRAEEGGRKAVDQQDGEVGEVVAVAGNGALSVRGVAARPAPAARAVRACQRAARGWGHQGGVEPCQGFPEGRWAMPSGWH